MTGPVKTTRVYLSCLLIILFVFTLRLLATKDEVSVQHKVKDEEPIDPIEFWTFISVISILVVTGGIFAGLTIGLMSLDETNLNIIMRSGTETQKKYAQRIIPIRQNTHLLLVTLLLGNTIINESLPILFKTIRLDGYQAVLISTCLILLFGEIIPQAVCARYGLAIGAFFAWPVRILMWIVFIVAYPIAKLLDFVLGTQEGVIYRRAELRELVELHGEGHGGTLTTDEVQILRSVLEIRDKTVVNVMTRLEDVFMLSSQDKLDKETLEKIMGAGHSRIPVYKGSRENIVGVILAKQLITWDPSKATPISEIKIRRLPRIRHDTALFEILHVFEEGGSHMALVIEDLGPLFPSSDAPAFIPKSPALRTSRSSIASPGLRTIKTLGIVTLEDVIEELLGQEIIDETDVYVDIGTKVKVARAIMEKDRKFSTTWRSPSEKNLPEPTEETPLLDKSLVIDENTRLLLNTKALEVQRSSIFGEPLSPSPSKARFPKKKLPAPEYSIKENLEELQVADVYGPERMKDTVIITDTEDKAL